MGITVTGGLTVDISDRHYICFDPTIWQALNDHFRNHIDRRNTGQRGPAQWFNAAVSTGLRSGHVPDNPGLVVTTQCRYGMRWAPGVYPQTKQFWRDHARHLEGHRRGHSLLVNLWVLDALQTVAPIVEAQQRLPKIPAAGPRPRRVAHTPLGHPDRAYLT